MQQTLRPYVTAGIAIVGSGLIAATPVIAPLPDVHVGRDIALTSALTDAMAPWIDQYNIAAENATVLANNFFIAPNVALQQFIANQQEFMQQIFDDPGNIPAVVNEMQEHLKAVTSAYSMIGLGQDETAATTILHTLSGSDLGTFTLGHDALFSLLPALLPAFLPAGTDTETIVPIVNDLINFISSPMSAMIMGSLGPALSPWVALMNSINDGDGLNEIMANMVGAYFNGATLNLDFVLPMLDGVVPPGTLTHLDFALGGLLTPGEVSNAAYTLYDASGNVISEVPAVGGSIFNSVGITLDASALLGQPLELAIGSHAIGPIGAMMAWSQTITGLLGGEAWNWAGKNGAPPAADPPLSGFSFPTIPADFFDDGGPSGADGSNLFADLGLDDIVAWLTP